jgi:hypothetical protein
VWLVFAFVHQKRFESPTPASRLDLLHALVVQRTVSIDAYHQNTPDKAYYKGHFYSDKAPGTVALAFPAFGVACGLLALLEVPVDSKTGWLVTSWLACAGSIALITALGMLALVGWLELHVPARAARMTVLALFLGAAPLPYATMMFSHALVVGLLAIAIWAIARAPGAAPNAGQTGAAVGSASQTAADPILTRQAAAGADGSAVWRYLCRHRWELLAGGACGWALASEFTAGLVVAGLLAWLVSMGWRRALPFCLATTPPLLLIPAYSWACFGDPFTLPYSHQATFPEMGEGLYAIQWPDPETAYRLVFSPTRGLLFWTPFLILAVPGYPTLFRRAPRLFWLTYAVPALQLLVISGRTWDWQAGFALGPRLLTPMLPLLALPCALGVQRFPRLGIGLAVYSILITTLATLTDACPDYTVYNPLTELHLPLLLLGEFSPNLGRLLGLSPYASGALFYALLVGVAWWFWRAALLEPAKSRV